MSVKTVEVSKSGRCILVDVEGYGGTIFAALPGELDDPAAVVREYVFIDTNWSMYSRSQSYSQYKALHNDWVTVYKAGE